MTPSHAQRTVLGSRRFDPLQLVALTKPRITSLAVTTAAVGLALAPGHVSISVLCSLLIGTGLIVGSANTLNMYLEREVDRNMPRTRDRPLPAGRVTPQLALRFGLAQGVLGLLLLGLGTRWLTAMLGAIALVVYVLIYTPMKQRTFYALFVGAVPGALPPLLGWTAPSGAVTAGGVCLFLVLFCWQIPHFLAISLFRHREYAAAGLKVMPNEVGERATRVTIVVWLVLQLMATLALVPAGLGDRVYLACAVGLGSVMLAWGCIGLFRAADESWARRLFALSVVFLPLWLGLLVL